MAGWGAGAVLAALLSCEAVPAQDITLTARGGGLVLDGQLQGYDGEFYRIDTVNGVLTADAEGVICDGPACPRLLAPLAQIRIAGAPELATRLLPPLFAAFAASRGLRYSPGPDNTAEISDPDTDKPLARVDFKVAPSGIAPSDALAGRIELTIGTEDLPDLAARPVGLEPLIAIVANYNRLPRIRAADLAAALTGAVTNWQGIGGLTCPSSCMDCVPDLPCTAKWRSDSARRWHRVRVTIHLPLWSPRSGAIRGLWR